MSEVTLGDHPTLVSFFHEQIDAAQERCGTELTEEVEAYVVRMLAEYARRTGVAGRHSPPLAIEFLSAQRRAGNSRALALRELGDRALFIAGVVPRSFERAAVDVSYVRAIGESAYRQIAARGALAVFFDLAERFEEVSLVIGDTVECSDPGRPTDLMALYERWRRHGHSRDARRLLAAGVLLDPKGSDTVQ